MFAKIFPKHLIHTNMNSDVLLMSILFIGVILLNKETIRSEFYPSKEEKED